VRAEILLNENYAGCAQLPGTLNDQHQGHGATRGGGAPQDRDAKDIGAGMAPMTKMVIDTAVEVYADQAAVVKESNKAL
jgi:hypothetical protein